MSKCYSVELIMDGSIDDLSKVMNGLTLLDTLDKDYLLKQLDENKSAINKINNSNIVRVFIDYTTKNINSAKAISNLSNQYPKVSFIFRREADDSFIEKQYIKGILTKENSFNNLINWRLHTHNMVLNSEEVCEFIQNDLEYLIDDIENYNEFKELVLENFEGVMFTTQYSEDDLLKDIKESYEYLII